MIPGDWENMTQAVWQSPLLPLASLSTISENTVFGSGTRFKHDILAYLECYGRKRTGRLVAQLKKHDFSTVKAALIASVPSREKVGAKSTLWGWQALKDTIRQIPKQTTQGEPHVVIQVGLKTNEMSTWLLICIGFVDCHSRPDQ